MKRVTQTLMAVSALMVCSGLVAAKPGDIKFGMSYSESDATFKPTNGNQNKSETDSTAFSVSYQLDKRWTLAGNFSRSEFESRGTNNSVNTDSDTDIFGLTATYKINNNLSAFGGYTYGKVDTSTVIDPAFLFFDNDIDLDVFTGGLSFFNPLNRSVFYGVVGVVSYASTDLDDYLLQTSQNARPGDKSSVTTLTLTPTVAYKRGPMLYTFNYSFSHKNRAGGAEPDANTAKLKLGVKYSINRQWSVGLTYSEVASKKAVDSDSLSLKLGYKL